MLKDDRMISILSGIVLMLALGVVAQRADMLSGLLGTDEVAVELRGDSAIVDTGRLMRIDVLSNDRGLPEDASTALTVARPPECGQVFVQAGALQYFADETCIGQQSFAYGITGQADVSADVSIVVRRTASARPAIAAAPAPAATAPDDAAADGSPSGAAIAEGSGAPAPVVLATAPDPVLAPPADPVPPAMPDALRRPEPASPARTAAPTAPDETAPDGASAGPITAPPAPARVPVPLIGMESVAAAEVPPDQDVPRRPLGTLPADIAGPAGTASAAPSHPEPDAVGTVAVLRPLDTLPVAAAEGEPLGDSEPSLADLATLPLPAVPAGNDAPEIGADTVPERPTPVVAIAPTADPGASAARPDHPATVATVEIAALAAGDTRVSDAVAGSDPLPRVRRGVAAPLAPSAAAETGPALFILPETGKAPLEEATEPRPAPPARLASIAESALTPLIATDAAPSPFQGAVSVPAAAALPPEPGLPGTPPHSADPLASAAEPAPIRLASLGVTVDAGGAPAGATGLPAAAQRAALPGGIHSPPEVPGRPAVPAQPEPESALAALPSATDVCTQAPQISSFEHPAAFTEVIVDAPCLAGSIVYVAHEGLEFGFVLSDEGHGSIMVPGLRGASRVRVDFADGKSVALDLRFRDIDRVQRLVVAWDAPVEFGLHAFESGADVRGAPGHVGPAHPRSFGEVRIAGGGFLTQIPSAGPGTQKLGVYTLWLSRRGPSGVVRMELDFVSRREAGGAGACGESDDASPEYVLLVTGAGRVEPLTRNRIAALDCAAVPSEGDGFVTGALPNLVVSTR